MVKKAFIFATGSDTGGAAIRAVEAFQAMEGGELESPAASWHVRSMVASDNYIRYSQDLPYDPALLERLYDEADVVHLNNSLHGHDWYDNSQGKPSVMMHHGLHKGHFDTTFEEMVVKAAEIGTTQTGSTVNLELYGTKASPIRWTPIPYSIEALANLRARLFEHDPQERIRIGHAPTDRAIKSTEAVISAVKSLQNRGFPVELVLIEHQTHMKTLEMKAKHVDIYVDQLKLGYGCNTIEAWGMGIPVIAGVSDYPKWRRHMVARFDCKDSPTGLPFIETSEEKLEATLESLVRDRAAYDFWSVIGRQHALRFHDQAPFVKLMFEIYEEASHYKTTPSSPLTNRRVSRLAGIPRAQRLARLREAAAQRKANREVGESNVADLA